ncbi:MAG: FBP domain-containing protein [Bdellovibrionales bacterium]
MIRISSSAQLLESFRDLDREEVQIPPTFRFPLAIKDYISWIEASGHRVYLVVEDPENRMPLGVVFQRTHGSSDTAAAMCQWCHAVRTGRAVSLLTAAAGRNRRIGLHLCSDLNCKENALSPPGIHDFQEAVTGRARVQSVVQRMVEFTKRHLF